MNVRKMRQIGKDILNEPRRFNMRDWFQTLERAVEQKIKPPCGCVACFAGHWGIRYAGADIHIQANAGYGCGVLPQGLIVDLCAHDLSLPNSDLFYIYDWPPKHRNKIANLKEGSKSYARYFVEVVLEDYIATNGWESA